MSGKKGYQATILGGCVSSKLKSKMKYNTSSIAAQQKCVSFVENNIPFVSMFRLRGKVSSWFRIVFCIFMFPLTHDEISLSFPLEGKIIVIDDVTPHDPAVAPLATQTTPPNSRLAKASGIVHASSLHNMTTWSPFFHFFFILIIFHSWSIHCHLCHLWSCVVHSWSSVVTRGHPWSLVCSFRQDP